MGTHCSCQQSKGVEDVPGEAPARLSSGGKDGDEPKRNSSRIRSSVEISRTESKSHHERLRRLRDLDGSTKIPFILIELRGHGQNDGYVEVCGKDEYGVYLALDEWLVTEFRCTKLDGGDLSDDTPLPFSDSLYKWQGFLVQGSDGTNNIGLATMQVIAFMCGKLSWTLGVVNGGNVGKSGEIREQQIIFKAPHPMNLVADHLMIELRSAGYIEVCGSSRAAKDKLHENLMVKMKARGIEGHQNFSDRYYECESGLFKERGKSGENNLGLLTIQVCDEVVKTLTGWSLVTMNGGNYGEGGTHREQQLVFRYDEHPLGAAPHLMVEFREAGFIEVCGSDVDGIYSKLSTWLVETWGCQPVRPLQGQEQFCDRKFTWKPNDMMVTSSQVTEFFHGLGWQMQVCSQGTVAVKGSDQSREQQILFRPGASTHGYVEPHVFLELYTGEGSEELYASEDKTQLLANQFIRIREIGDCATAAKAVEELGNFLIDYMGGVREPDGADYKSFAVDVFLARGLGNNLGCWTMRLCDFMVDRLGWSFVVCNVCNLGHSGQYREQQLVFRYDGERRDIPPVQLDRHRLDEVLFVNQTFPSYWKTHKVLSLRQNVSIVKCTEAEKSAMQDIFDNTFKRVLTRDRVFEYQLNIDEEMPYRLEIVRMFRSEHAELFRKYMERRGSWIGKDSLQVKTRASGELLNGRLLDGEALLIHGTNPSSAMGILKTGFQLSAAGKSTGTMFGYGIYLAENVSKSDEYARDDNGGTYPGLMALLLCRSFIGDPHIVTEAGDYIAQAKADGKDCVIGDRESKVGTYREFIFFDERQVLPEYAVIYKRQYDKQKVPQHMAVKTKGTTGRNWQVKLEKGGWVNLPPLTCQEISKAEADGHETCKLMSGDNAYVFDFKAKTQTNVKSGTVRPIRPPMKR